MVAFIKYLSRVYYYVRAGATIGQPRSAAAGD